MEKGREGVSWEAAGVQGAAGVAVSRARENEWRRREAGKGGEREGAGAEKLVGESPGSGRGGGGTGSGTRGWEPRGRAGQWGKERRRGGAGGSL